jgi:hypothetical protein
MNKPNKFKQAIQALREIEYEFGHTRFIEELVSKRVAGYSKATFPELSNAQLNFLDKIGLEYRFRKDVCEWEIILT